MRNKKYFKRSIKRLTDNFLSDTIWLANYFKPRHYTKLDKWFRWICYSSVSRKESIVIDLDKARYVKFIECKAVEPSDMIYTLTDISESKEILRYIRFFIGTPSF